MKYNVLYMAKVDDKYQVCSVLYSNSFSSYANIDGAEGGMECNCYCDIEHIECKVINERKIGIDGVLMVKATVHKISEFEIAKSIDDESIQILKKVIPMDKVIANLEEEVVSKCTIEITSDNPEIGRILKCEVCIHKKEVKLYDNKIEIQCFALFKILYRSIGEGEICYLQDEILITKEVPYDGIDSFMDSKSEFMVEGIEYDIKEDDLGEYRIVDIEALIKISAKITSKNDIETIEDAYSPNKILKMEKKNYDLNIALSHKYTEAIVKENLEVDLINGKPSKVLMATGNVCVTDKRIVEGKVIVEGLVWAHAIYSKESELGNVEVVSEEIPFMTAVDIPGAKINMQCGVKVNLETMEAMVEASTIGIKALVLVDICVYYSEAKEFIVDISEMEGEPINKKASITIYVVQPGDSLWKVAKKYYTTIEALAKVNEIDEDSGLSIGDKLIIPGRAII
jgi:LysM repeat protein